MQPAIQKMIIATITCLFLTTACEQDVPPTASDNQQQAASGNSSQQTVGQSADQMQSEQVVPEDCTLVMGFDPWEPYHFESADGEIRGVDVELVQAMAGDVGCGVEFLEDQWINLLPKLRDGDIDLLAGATLIPERQTYAWFSSPYRSERFELFVAPSRELNVESVDEMLNTGLRMGLTEGYIYGEPISSAQLEDGYTDQFVYASIAEVNFANLADGRIDGFWEDPFVAAAIMRRHGWQDRVKPTGILIGTSPVSLMFSKAQISAEQVEAFNAALAELIHDGREKVIFDRYLND